MWIDCMRAHGKNNLPSCVSLYMLDTVTKGTCTDVGCLCTSIFTLYHFFVYVISVHSKTID